MGVSVSSNSWGLQTQRSVRHSSVCDRLIRTIRQANPVGQRVCLARVLMIYSVCTDPLSSCWLWVFLSLLSRSIQSSGTCEVGIEFSSVINIECEVLVCWTHWAWSVINKQIASSCWENVGRIWIKALKRIGNPTARLLPCLDTIEVCLDSWRFDGAWS